jgi:uncharacterized cupin superfamily protein
MVPEAPLESTEHGLVPKGDGWVVLNAREVRWLHAPGRSAICDFEGDQDFAQLGINLSVLGPGEAMAMYHWEADQEDFLVLAGEALLIVEGEERPLRQWGGYSVDQAALRHGAGVEHETTDAKQAYARFRKREPTRYREGWLPE